jgi:hypothetical protein
MSTDTWHHIGTVWVAVGPLIGVAVGGAITGGFQLFTRRQDRRDHYLGQLTEVVLGVHEACTETIFKADILELDLIQAANLQAIRESPAFIAYSQSEARYLVAVTRARILCTGRIREWLIVVQDAVHAMTMSAIEAAGAIGTPDHPQKLATFALRLNRARTAHSVFMLRRSPTSRGSGASMSMRSSRSR